MTSPPPVATASGVKMAVALIDLNPSGLTAKEIEEIYSNPQVASLAGKRIHEFVKRRNSELAKSQIPRSKDEASTYFKAEPVSHFNADEDSTIEVCDGSLTASTSLLRLFSNILSSTTAYTSYVISMTQFRMTEIKIIILWLKGHYTDHEWPKQIDTLLQIKIAMIAHILEIPALQFQIMASLHKIFIDDAKMPNSDSMNQIWLISGHNSDPLLQLVLASMYVNFAFLELETKDLQTKILRGCARGCKHRNWARNFDAYLGVCTFPLGNEHMMRVMTIEVDALSYDKDTGVGWKNKFLDPIQRRRNFERVKDQDFFCFSRYNLKEASGHIAAHEHLASMGYLTLPLDKEMKLPIRHVINQHVTSKSPQQNKKRVLPDQSFSQVKKRVISTDQSISIIENIPRKSSPERDRETTSSGHSSSSMSKKPKEEIPAVADQEYTIVELKPSSDRKICVINGADLVIACRDQAFLFNRIVFLPNAFGIMEILHDRPYLETLHLCQIHSTGLRVLHDLKTKPDFNLQCKKITLLEKSYAIGAAYGIGDDGLCDILIDELLDTFKEQAITIEVAEEICEQIKLPYLEQKALEALHYGLWYDKSSQPGTITGMTRHQKAMSNVGESYRKVHDKLCKLKQKDHPGRIYARCTLGHYLNE